MTNNNKSYLKGIAWVSAIFGMVVCLLVIANYFQLSRIDPVNTEVINQLVDRLQENPNDEQLRIQIREMDLLARKAYFTNTWQVKVGGYLILIALAVFVIAYQIMDANVKKQVLANPDQPKDILGLQKNARVGVAIVGGSLVVVALLLAFLTENKLSSKVQQKMAEKTEVVDESTVEIAIVEHEAAKQEVIENKDEMVEEADQPAVKEEKVVEPSVTKEEAPKSEAETPKSKENSFPSVEELKINSASFRGYHSNGIVYQDNVPKTWDGTANKNILWKVEIPVQGYNSPIVWNNKVFLTGATEAVREVFCYDTKSGKLLWRTKIVNIPGSPAKAPKTTADTGLAAPTMATDGKYVYAIFGTGDVVALDMDGNIVWGKNLGVPQNHYGHSSSLLMYKDKLIVQYDQKNGGKILALEGKTGNELWSTARKVKISWASPVLIEHKGKAQIVLASDPLVAAYDPETGTELWKVDCIFGEVGPSVCYADGIVYAMNEYAVLAAINVDNPTQALWESDELLSDVPSPIASNGLLIVPASYGVVACYDAKSGEFLWEHEFGNNIYSSPMLVGENVYLTDMTGITHVFKLKREGFELVAENPLGGDVVCTPAFAGGRIYIRTNKNLYCIGK